MFSLLTSLYHTLLDALFPLSGAEQELFSLSPEQAWQELGRAPDYSGLAVPLPSARSVFAYKDERVAKMVWNIKYKRSVQAVKMGGYALFQALNEKQPGAPAGKQILQDTPSTSAEVATSSRLPSQPPKCPSESLSAGAPISSTQQIPATKHILIVPIPITTKRRRERGYNQCELLVDDVERLMKEQDDLQPKEILEAKPRYMFEKNLLIRTQHATRQTLKGREDRVESAKRIFGVDEKVIERLQIKILKDSGAAIEKVPVIIVDDVITTGSTMHEAIETLKKAGFSNVRALSLAH